VDGCDARTRVRRLGALSVAADTALAIAGITHPAQGRAIPPLFVLHAVAGAFSLVGGALQMATLGTTLRTRPWIHRLLGRMYISASLTTSLAGLAVTSNFDDVGLPARRRSPSKVPSGFAPQRSPTTTPTDTTTPGTASG
jgi:hypothetical protein